jgi:hypothetical protein
MEVTLIRPTDYLSVLEFAKNRLDFHHIFAAIKYFLDGRLEGVEITIFQIIDENRRLYCVIHEILNERCVFMAHFLIRSGKLIF